MAPRREAALGARAWLLTKSLPADLSADRSVLRVDAGESSSALSRRLRQHQFFIPKKDQLFRKEIMRSV